MAKVKRDGHWGFQLILFAYFSFCGNQTIFGWDVANSKFYRENSVKDIMGRVKSDGHIWGLTVYSIWF